MVLIILIHKTNCQDSIVYQTPWTVDWSPDGKYIAIGGETKGLKIYDSKLGLLKLYPFNNNITRVKWHPDKHILSIATQLESNSSNGKLYCLEQEKWINLQGLENGARGI